MNPKSNALRRIATACVTVGLLGLVTSTSARADTAGERLALSAAVLKEVMATPDKAIPDDLLKSSYCVVIVPHVKGASFGIGGKYGRGFVLCRKENNAGWGAPAAVRMEGGSFGFQIGASETDVVMLVMDKGSIDGLLSSKFTVGGAAEAAAGPVGRSSTAQTDATMRAKILSYSRSRGVFAGVALTGATLRQDLDENKEMYGKPLSNKEIINTGIAPPATAAELITLLNGYSHVEK